MSYLTATVLMIVGVMVACAAITLLFSGGWGTAVALFGGYCIYKHFEDRP